MTIHLSQALRVALCHNVGRHTLSAVVKHACILHSFASVDRRPPKGR
jgi:hypothetical protein